MKNRPPLPIVLPLIRVVRGQRVILDSDLARLYGVTTSHLNQQFRRNRRRFPGDFAFELTRKEAGAELAQFVTTPGMLSHIVTASGKRNRRRAPIAFTEHGAVMAANVLKSERATAMSVEVVRAFVSLRRLVSSNEKIALMLEKLQTAVALRLDRHDKEIEALFGMLAALVEDAPAPGAGKRGVGRA